MTATAIDRLRRQNQHRSRNQRCAVEIALEALERALDALRHEEWKLVEREVEVAKEKLERIA